MVRDLSSLPRARAVQNDKQFPVTPMFTRPMVDNWYMHRLNQEQRPTVVAGQPWRPSKAGSCQAEMWFTAKGYRPDEPEKTAHWSFEMGQSVHDWLDQWMLFTYPGIQLEHQYTMTWNGMHFGGNADAFHPDLNGQRVAFEFKSINGLGYQKSVLDGEGPRESAEMQACIAGAGTDADLVVVIYVGLQVVSAGQAKRKNVHDPEYQRFIAEWHYSRARYEAIAERELNRVTHAISTDEPQRVPLGIPVGAEVYNPATGAWNQHDENGTLLNTGNAWNCDYCGQRANCLAYINGDLGAPPKA